MNSTTLRFIKEHLALLTTVIMLLLSPGILRAIDPEAGVYDPGVYQNVFLIATEFAIFQWFTWSILKAIWPVIARYADSIGSEKEENSFIKDLKSIQPWQRIKTFLFIYFSILACFLVLAVALR